MNTMHKIEHWADTHHPLWMDGLRIALGLFLLIKGIIFISDTEALMAQMQSSNIAFASMAMAHYIGFAHMIGGLFIALGVLTRLFTLLQIPILIGAVFFVNRQGFFSAAYNLEFWISLVVLMLLIVFTVYGNGILSIKGRRRKEFRTI